MWTAICDQRVCGRAGVSPSGSVGWCHDRAVTGAGAGGASGRRGWVGEESWCLVVVVVERCDAVLVMARIAALRSADGASECE